MSRLWKWELTFLVLAAVIGPIGFRTDKLPKEIISRLDRVIETIAQILFFIFIAAFIITMAIDMIQTLSESP